MRIVQRGRNRVEKAAIGVGRDVHRFVGLRNQRADHLGVEHVFAGRAGVGGLVRPAVDFHDIEGHVRDAQRFLIRRLHPVVVSARLKK